MFKNSFVSLSALLVLLTMTAVSLASGNRIDSRMPYVHTISLYDRDGNRVDYKDKFEAQPYSPSVTCGKCHDIEAISQGHHFNAQADIPAGRVGEPWIWTEPGIRTQLPLSYRAWPGTWRPAAVGIDSWQFTRHFGRHMTSGAAKEEAENVDDLEVNRTGRWHITGDLEIDCLICHSGDRRYNPQQWAQQIEEENFQWAPTAATSLAIIKGNTKDIPEDYDPEFPELSIEEVDLPMSQYDASRFDQQELVYFDIVRQPPNERCYYCHTTQGVGENLAPRFQRDSDVHMRAGMNCSDCHRHGLDHQVVRGYEGEEKDSANAAAGTLTCRACHIGDPDSDDPLLYGGRLGAPLAEHDGIPQVHFDKLECTTCHSGLWPQESSSSIQTAMAHALGLTDEHRHPEDPPYLTEPVFVRQENGKIGIHRMVWPTFWAMMEGEEITPITLDVVREKLEKTLKVDHKEKENFPRGWKPVATEQIKTCLEKLQNELAEQQRAVYVTSGQVYQLEADKVTSFDHPVTAGYSWPLGHDVRGAGQSLGALTCTDCHAKDAPFFYGEMAVTGGDQTTGRKSMISMQGEYGPEFKKTNLFFKWLIYVTMGALLLHILADLIGTGLRRIRSGKEQNHPEPHNELADAYQRFDLQFRLQHVTLMISVLILIFTGIWLWAVGKPDYIWWSRDFGGLGIIRLLHRTAGLVLTVLGIYHLGYILFTCKGRREFWYLLPRFKDVQDLLVNLAYFFHLRKTPPKFDRFTYYEKFDYWAVYWGCVIMIGTGLLLWFDRFAAQYLPWLPYKLSAEIHADEAILATLAIFVWHFYNVHFKPGKFPGSGLWIHGRISHTEMVEHHPLEYERNKKRDQDGT